MKDNYIGYGRCIIHDEEQFAKITIRVSPHPDPTIMSYSKESLDYLLLMSDDECIYHQQMIMTGFDAVLRIARITGKMPHVEKTSFHINIISIYISSFLQKEILASLLIKGCMDALEGYLLAWEASQTDS